MFQTKVQMHLIIFSAVAGIHVGPYTADIYMGLTFEVQIFSVILEKMHGYTYFCYCIKKMLIIYILSVIELQ